MEQKLEDREFWFLEH